MNHINLQQDDEKNSTACVKSNGQICLGLLILYILFTYKTLILDLLNFSKSNQHKKLIIKNTENFTNNEKKNIFYKKCIESDISIVKVIPKSNNSPLVIREESGTGEVKAAIAAAGTSDLVAADDFSCRSSATKMCSSCKNVNFCNNITSNNKNMLFLSSVNVHTIFCNIFSYFIIIISYNPNLVINYSKDDMLLHKRQIA